MTGRGQRLRVAAAALGVCAGVFGVAGLLGDARLGSPLAVFGWLAAVLVVHDGLLLPAIVAVAAGLGRVLPPGSRGIVLGGLGVAAVTGLVTLPLLVRKGAIRNASMLPLDYARNLLLILAAVAIATIALSTAHVLRAHRAARHQRRLDHAAARRMGRTRRLGETPGGPDRTGG